jgi:hypothetical protein
MSKSSTLSNIGRFVFSALVASSIFGSGAVIAEEELIGSNEFRISCASCHGVGGRGNGNMAQFLTVKPSDLTALAKNNGGEYPFMRVFQMIDGRAVVSGHGDRAMPVWGSRYKKEDAERYGPYGGEEVVRARVLELVYYIQSIQQK